MGANHREDNQKEKTKIKRCSEEEVEWERGSSSEGIISELGKGFIKTLGKGVRGRRGGAAYEKA